MFLWFLLGLVDLIVGYVWWVEEHRPDLIPQSPAPERAPEPLPVPQARGQRPFSSGAGHNSVTGCSS